MEIKNKKVLIYDLGLQAELAVRLARDVAQVWYFVPATHEIYPTPLKYFIGMGLEGVEKVKSFFPYVDKADVIIIPDGQLGDIVEFLRKHNYPVAGSGKHNWLETERWRSRKAQAEMELPTQETRSLTGVQELCDFFSKEKNWMVKGNGFRGLFDSFAVRDWKDLEPTINFLKYKLGPFSNDLPFMVEEIREGIETGYDTISWNEKQVWPSILSLAAKDECYLGKVCSEQEMPPGYRLMHKLLGKELADYRFFYSVETITGKDAVPYLIDLTMRIGSPSPLSIYLELYENFVDVICGMAIGEQVNPIAKFKYASSVNMTLRQDENFTNLHIPQDIRRWVKLVKGCKKGTDYYACPEWEVAATVVAFGNTVEEAIKLNKERCGEVKGKGLVDNSGCLDDYAEDIKKAKEIGIDF